MQTISLSKLRKVLLSAFQLASLISGAILYSGLSYAHEWQVNTFEVLVGDAGDDAIDDIYLRPVATAFTADLPYDITVESELQPQLGHGVIVENDEGVLLEYYDSSEALEGIEWASGAELYVEFFGDFNGDSLQDLLLRAIAEDGKAYIILGFEAGGRPSIFQSLSAESLGMSPATDTTLVVRDVDGNGSDDIILEFADGAQKAMLSGVSANGAANFTPALGYPFCSSEGVVDTDCDGTSDRYDASRFDPNITASIEQTIQAANVGVVAGSFNVSSDGKAAYSIPIKSVPGIESVEPALALSYSQQAGNGIVGVGWHISGLSEVSRCPTTLVQDGYINGVNFNDSDRFCLNGQRLIPVAANEYRTENDSFAKIVSSGAIAGAPATFTVYKASGEIEVYGGTANSRRLAETGGAVYSWALSRLEDRESNFAEYLYHNAAASGEFWIERIDYQGRSVRFEYQNRPDVTTSQAQSITTTHSKRLNFIRTYLGEQQVRNYELQYTLGENNRSLVETVKECLGSGISCLPATKFTWDKGIAGSEARLTHAQTESPSGGNAAYKNHQYHMGDINADGLSDIVWTYRNGNTLGRVVFLADGQGSFNQQSAQNDEGYFADIVEEGDQQTLLADVNGDGKSDLIWVARHLDTVVRSVYLANASGTGFDAQGYEVHTNPNFSEILQSRFQTGDVNGDGLADLIWTYHYNNTVAISTYLAFPSGNTVSLGHVSSLVEADYSPDYYLHHSFATGDVNGDTKTDVVWTFAFQNKFYRILYLANPSGDGFIKTSVSTDDFDTIDTQHQMSLGDINADGKSDLVWTYNNGNQFHHTVYLASRKGTSFVKEQSVASSLLVAGHTAQQARLSDMNGDGKQDLIYSFISNTTFGWETYLANRDGKGFSRHSSGSRSVSSSTENHEYRFGDITGDGKADLVWTYNSTTGALHRSSFIQRQSYPDHIERVTDGLGNTIDVEYSYLADSPNYAKGAPVSYPLRSDAGLSYVVTKVSESNGIGGQNQWEYQYSGARTHLRGRGFLGFESRTIIDVTRGLSTQEHYLQEFPYIGQLKSSQTRNGDIVIEETHNDWQSVAINDGKTVFRYLDRQGVVKRNLESGQMYYGAVIDNTYNHDFGYLDESVTTTGKTYDNFTVSGTVQTVTTDLNYAINEENWRIRFINEEIKTFSVPGETSRALHKKFTPWDDDSILTLSETDYVGSEIEQTRTYDRDAIGNILSVTVTGSDIDGGQIEPQIDAVNRYIDGIYAETSTNAQEHTETSVFDHRYGSLTRHTDFNQLVTDIVTDGYGHLLFKRSADGSELHNTYKNCGSACPKGAVYSVTSATSHPLAAQVGAPESTIYFDQKAREVARQTQNQNGGDVWVKTEYDSLGRVKRKSQPYITGAPIYWTEYAYDKLDRVTYELRPDQGSTTSEYLFDNEFGVHGRVTSRVANPLGGIKTLVSHVYTNSIGQMRRTIDAVGTQTNFDFNALGSIRQIEVNNNPDTQVIIETDLAGNKTGLIDPDIGSMAFEYDAVGRERRRTHGAGAGAHVTTTNYDRLGRILLRTDFDGTATQTGQWTYDPENGIGLIDEITNTDYYKKHRYDALARLAEVQVRLLGEEVPKKFTYSYDHYSRPKTTVYPSSLTVANQYGDRGYHVGVEDARTSELYWRANQRDAYGNVTEEVFGNGVKTARHFDQRMGRIENIDTGTNGFGNAYQALSYKHDSAGNLVRRTSKRNALENNVEIFTYDNLHRLLSSNTHWLGGAQRDVDYRYDRLGNITYKSDVSDVNGYSYGGNGGGVHAVSQIRHGAKTTQYGYDFKGNMVQRGSQQIDYSVFNKPIRIADATAVTELRYSPNRQRFYQNTTDDGVTTATRYYGSGFEIVNKEGWQREKATIGDFLVITRATHSADATVVGDLDYLHRDHLGSLEATSDRFGKFTGRFAFDPWGQRRQDDWNDPDADYFAAIDSRTFQSTTRGFTNHEHLDAVGLIHMNGRVYDPLIGRFISPDDYIQFPENSQSYNRYTYVLNNPLSYTDPSGEFIPLLIVGAIWAVKAYDAYSTAKDVHSIITDDNKSTAQKSLEIGAQVAMAFVPGKGLLKKFSKSPKGLKSADKPTAPTNNQRVGSKNAQEGNGSDKNTEKKAENREKEQADGAACTSKGCKCSFEAGTLVTTPEGLVPIEWLDEGDMLLARDEYTGEQSYKTINHAYSHNHDDGVEIWIHNGEALEQITTTSEHPFYVQGVGFVPAIELQAGMALSDVDGQYPLVFAIDKAPFDVVAYNFEVAEFHTYFVGESGVWVHNDCDESDVAKTADPKDLIPQQVPADINPNRVNSYRKKYRKAGGYNQDPIDVADVGGGRKIILDGHHRSQAAAREHMKEVPIKVHKVDRQRADELMKNAAEAEMYKL